MLFSDARYAVQWHMHGLERVVLCLCVLFGFYWWVILEAAATAALATTFEKNVTDTVSSATHAWNVLCPAVCFHLK